MDARLPAQIRRTAETLVDEYKGSISPGRVMTVAVMTGRRQLRNRETDSRALARWEERVRVRLEEGPRGNSAVPSADAGGWSDRLSGPRRPVGPEG
jgi:hypothetical protein